MQSPFLGIFVTETRIFSNFNDFLSAEFTIIEALLIMKTSHVIIKNLRMLSIIVNSNTSFKEKGENPLKLGKTPLDFIG